MDGTQWRTHRLEMDDQTLREWDARVLAADAEGIVLNRSAFYPGGGGQPPDHGLLLWGGVQTRIVDVRKADGGTHVASTRQVGRIEVVKIESKGRGFRRLRIRIAD